MNRTTTIFLVQGNTLKLAIPLTLRAISFSDGNAVCEDDDFIPSSDNPVIVELTDQSKKLAFEASMEGNVAVIEDRGNIPTGSYAVSVLCKDNEGNPYRFKQKAALRVVDTTEEAGITSPIEYEVKTWYLNAAIYLALKGEGGGGTVTAVKMNNDEPISPDANGIVNLGTILTQHQDISGKVDKESGKSLMTDAEHSKLAGLPTGEDLTTAMATKQNVLTFDDAPKYGSDNPVKSKGAKQAIDEKLSNVTVNAIPAGSVGIIDDCVTDSATDALSARQGKELNDRLEELEEGGAGGGGMNVTIDYNNSTKITTFNWGAPALPRSARPNITYATGETNVVVTITAATGATITAYVDDVLTQLDANGQITFARGAAGTATVTKTIRATALESGKSQSLAREVTVNIPAVDAVQTDSPTITAALDDNNNPTCLVVTATGNGTINLSVNGETATGSGTASVTIYCGDTALTGLTATATAQDTGEEVSDPATLDNISVPAATVPTATPTVTTTETDNAVTITATGNGEVKLYVDNVEQSGTSLVVNKGASSRTLSVYATAKEQGKTMATSATQSVAVGSKSTMLAGTCASNSPFNIVVGNSTYPASIEQEANQDGSYNWSVDIPTSALPTVSAESVTLAALKNATDISIFGGTSSAPDTNILTITAIPAAVRALADSCFKYCSELTDIDIHVNAGLFLGSACLYNTPKLRRLSIDSARLYCGTTIIQPCNSTTGDTTNGLEVVLSSRVAGSMALVSGGGAMFSGCTALRSINLEDTSITGLAIHNKSDSKMFYGCTGLTSISLPSTLTMLGTQTFNGCSNLATIDIGDDESVATQTIAVDRAPSNANMPFYDCGTSNLAVHIHSSVAALTNIRLPNKTKSITIAEGITDLYSFSGCTALTSVTLPESLKTTVAFYQCSALTSIVVNRWKPDDSSAQFTDVTYNGQAFYDVPANCAISVPYGSGSTYKSARNWSSMASSITERPQTT